MYTDEQIAEMQWIAPGETKKYSVAEIGKFIRAYIRNPEYKDYKYDVAIGTDSQMIGHAFQFISVISVHRIGKGGLYFYHKEFVPRAKFPIEDQKMRMYDEVARSIALGLHFREVQKLAPEIHIDASPSWKKEFTAKFSDELKGYVQGCGFECKLKPESYVAHAIADKHTKKKSRKKQRRMRQAERRRNMKKNS